MTQTWRIFSGNITGEYALSQLHICPALPYSCKDILLEEIQFFASAKTTASEWER